MMTTKHQFEFEIRRIISDRIEAICEHLGNGSANTYDEYQHKVGLVAGLRAAIDSLEEANSILEGKPR
jgi:hypothetical protein